MIEESWKQYKNSYWVSNFGNFREKDFVTPKVLFGGNRPSLGGKLAHRIIYILFVGEIPRGYCVYHADRNPLNNRVDNLILVSPKEKILNYSSSTVRLGLKITQEEFLKRAKNVHGNKYDYSDTIFKGSQYKIKYLCPKHGIINQKASDHWRGCGCSKCHFEDLKTWTDEEDKFLIKNYNDLGPAACANKLIKTKSSVATRAIALGITKKAKTKHPNVPAFVWGGLTTRLGKRRFCSDQRAELDFNINYVWEMYQAQNGKCALTGWNIVFSSTCKENTVSIDRIDSSKGYLKSNVRLVHKDVNRIKNHYSDEFFLKVCESVIAFKKSVLL